MYAGLIKNRLAKSIDDRIWKLQFGFRGKKSAAQAMCITRRLQDIVERSDEKLTMIFLDWEKAFDKMSHKALFLALERLNVDTKLIEGYSSKWYRQETGIRHGCPLSAVPVSYHHDNHDIKFDKALRRDVALDRIIGATFDEVFYADDTILFSTETKTLGKLVRRIEEEGEQYGLKLNKNKCP